MCVLRRSHTCAHDSRACGAGEEEEGVRERCRAWSRMCPSVGRRQRAGHTGESLEHHGLRRLVEDGQALGGGVGNKNGQYGVLAAQVCVAVSWER